MNVPECLGCGQQFNHKIDPDTLKPIKNPYCHTCSNYKANYPDRFCEKCGACCPGGLLNGRCDECQPCFLCVKQDVDPPATGDLCTGQRFHWGHERWIVFKGYLCGLHLSEDVRSVRFI